MANKLAIGALAAAAVASAPALAQEAPSPSPGSHQALRVCADAARENALEGCEELKKVLSNSAYQNAYLAQEVAIECVVLDGCLEADGPLIKVRPGSAGPQATQMIYCRVFLRVFTTRARLRPRARKFPRRQAAAVVVGAHRVTHGALAPKAKL